MKKVLSLLAIAGVALSISACDSFTADDSVYVEQWESSAPKTYKAKKAKKSYTRSYNDSLRK